MTQLAGSPVQAQWCEEQVPINQVTARFLLCNGQSCDSRMVTTWYWQP